MANSLSAVMPKILAQGLMTLRNSGAVIQAVNRDWGNDVAKKGDTINVPVPAAIAAASVTPNNVPPATADIAPTTVPIAMTNWQEAAFELTDAQLDQIMQQDVITMEQSAAIAALVDAITVDLYSKYVGVYGISGTAGTTPFATDITAATNARKVLNKQLAPLQDRHIIVNPDAEANALALAPFASFLQSDDPNVISEGQLGRKLGFDWAMSQQVPTQATTTLTAGAATVNGVNALGATTVSIAKATNTSPLIVGDILTIANQPTTYVVTANVTLAVGNTNVSISPALKAATVGGEAVTLTNAHVVNLAFQRNAFALASRPLSNIGGNALGSMFESAVDPVSGLALRLEVRREYKRTRFSYDVLWGSALVRPELACRILG